MILVSILILVIICFTAKIFFSKEEKKLAWSLSFCNSLSLSALGMYYLSQNLPRFPNLFVFGDYGRAPFHGTSNFSVMVNIWFALANIVDLVFGSLYYPKYLNLLSAWIHHIVFIWIMFTAATGNGIFLQTTPFGIGFCLMLIEEIPTFLLALGSIVPSCRTDIGFGATFFILRILYQLYFIIYAWRSKTDGLIHILYLLTLCLHLHWFYNWAVKYGFSTKREKPKCI